MSRGAEEKPRRPVLTAEDVAGEFELRPDGVGRVARHFVRQMQDGLAHHRPWQLPAYVRSVATGAETGQFLAVDLGGSNCRICLVDLHGDGTFAVRQTKHAVPADVMVGARYEPLFDFVAERLADFLAVHGGGGVDRRPPPPSPPPSPYRLGFTFSFTCEQTSLARGTLLHWDKGWDIPAAVGRDPCALLQEAVDRRGLPVRVAALANDSVGTLLTMSYRADGRGAALGAVIFGTGTNAAYVEKLRNVRRAGFSSASDDRSDDLKEEAACADAGDIMLINTEWGCFDDAMRVLPRTADDDALDAASANPGAQMFEKRVAGLYLGELLRLALLRLRAAQALRLDLAPDSPLFRPGGLDSAFLSQLAARDGDGDAAAALVAETHAALQPVRAEDVRAVQLVAAAIARRAARLAGASLAAMVLQSGRLAPPPPPPPPPCPAPAEQQQQQRHRRRLLHNHASAFRRFLARLGRMARRLLLCVVPGRRVSAVPAASSLPLPSSSPSPSPSTPPSPSTSPSPPLPPTQDADDPPADKFIDIGADGSVIELYPTFEADMRGALAEVPEIGPAGEKRIRIVFVKDGSGVGAALMAQAAGDAE